MNSNKAAAAIESVCFQIAKLDAKKQAMFIDALRGTLTCAELQALQIGIAYFRMILDGELREAMKATLAGELYQEFRRQIEKEV